MFLLIGLVPLLMYARYRWRTRRIVLRQPAVRRLTPESGGIGAALRPVLPVFFAAGLICLIVALARPQTGSSRHRVRTQGVDIVLSIDVSPTMGALDYEENGREYDRLEAVKRVADKFIRGRPNDRIGLVGFSTHAYSLAPLTLDHGWLITQIQRLSVGDLGDATAIGDGLATALNRLRDSKARSRVVVLLTDGINNTGDIEPLNAALAAQALGIKVYTVGAGSYGVARIPIRDAFGQTRIVHAEADIDEATLKRIAELTGGRYFRAADMEGLKKTFEEIDQLEKSEIEVEQFTRWEERFQPFVFAAIVLLALEQLLGLWRLERFP